MPTIKELYNKLDSLEKLDNSEGAYPVYFNSEYSKIKFILYCRWRTLLKKVKKLCHL